jgi:hypothetical protein
MVPPRGGALIDTVVEIVAEDASELVGYDAVNRKVYVKPGVRELAAIDS